MITKVYYPVKVEKNICRFLPRVQQAKYQKQVCSDIISLKENWTLNKSADGNIGFLVHTLVN